MKSATCRMCVVRESYIRIKVKTVGTKQNMRISKTRELQCIIYIVLCVFQGVGEKKKKRNTHRGARTPDHTVKSRALYRLS